MVGKLFRRIVSGSVGPVARHVLGDGAEKLFRRMACCGRSVVWRRTVVTAAEVGDVASSTNENARRGQKPATASP